MSAKSSRQFGLWKSPVTSRNLAQDRRLEVVCCDSDSRTTVWLEGRSGRGVLMAIGSDGDAPRELTGDLSVRAEVGYGGGDFTVHSGHLFFVVHKSGRLYRQPLTAGTACAITPAFGSVCSPVVSSDGRWVAYVHNDGEDNDRIAVVDASGAGWPQILAAGHDFCMQPRWSPDGRRFAWIAWDHPNMPWDGTTLYLADVIEADGAPPRLGEPRQVAGGPETAVFQPEFSPDGRSLLYVCDESGWGRIAVYDLQTGVRRWLTANGVEHGAPAWQHDMQTYAVSHDSRKIIAVRSDRGFHSLCQIDLGSGENKPIDALRKYTEITHIAAAAADDRIVLTGSSGSISPRIIEHNLSSGSTRVLARASGEIVSPSALAECERISWNSAGGEEVYGLFYPPSSDRFEGIGKPPLIAMIHGGPTSQVKAGWKPQAQFFATRGYAVLYVNYRGSTGYGREYMLKLRGNWGICDVEDAISGKNHLVETGRVDPDRTVIMGGSAGGFTVLHTLSQRPESFTAGVNLYGVANQFHLASETHKFESRYLNTMLGPLPAAAQIYRERSPVFHADHIIRPLAVFQGDIDRVVPREQSETVVEALRKSGTPHVYHVYEDEGHGWRKRETIEHFYDAVEKFLRTHVIFS